MFSDALRPAELRQDRSRAVHQPANYLIPVGGDSERPSAPGGEGRFQSTPPRGGRPHGRRLTAREPHEVSIHAPAWGATVYPRELQPRLSGVSIHAPAWGATAKRAARTAGSGFNPRPRVGGDPLARASAVWRSVSIHAPAWGATVGHGSSLIFSSGFQSTPPRGGRPRRGRFVAMASRFNPRPRVGGDPQRRSG